MEADDSLVEIHVNIVGPWAAPEALLEKGCRAALHACGTRHGEVSLTLLDDAGISALNQDYFQKDFPTDVIAFSLHAPGDPVLGDVYLGYEQACRQADELDIRLEEELLRLAIHGTLHVLGFDHPEGEDREESDMYRTQEELLSQVLAGPPG
ncbi:MAG: rRNA maturation RNase YbeY [Gemmatimonadota bacterium]